MEKFIDALTVKSKTERLNLDKVDKLIRLLNEEITKQKDNQDTFVINTVLDKAPHLTVTEFQIASREALKYGWVLTMKDDDYNTVSYRLKKM